MAAAADCCPQPATPAQPAQPAEPAGGEEAKAKAAEMKGKEAEAKAKAQQEGKPVDGESPIKPTPVNVPKVPAAQAKPGGAAAPTAQTPAKSAEPPKSKPAAGGKSDGDAGAKGGGGGGAASAAQGAVDEDVRGYLEKAPHQPDQISPQVKELMSSADGLKKNAPPPGGGGGIMGALKDGAKMMLPGADSALAKDKDEANNSDLGKMMGKGDNPFANANKFSESNQNLAKLANWMTKIRDFLSGASSILGKIGMVLSIIGVVISLTGIGAALGGPIATIGRVISLITLIMDAVCMGLSTALVVVGGIMYKREQNPEMRAALAKQLISDANSTFSSALSVAMAIPGVKKLAGVLAGGVKKIATGLITKIAAKLGLKAGATLLKSLGKQIFSLASKGLGKVTKFTSAVAEKVSGLFKSAGPPGKLSKLLTSAKEGIGDLAKGAWSGTKNVASKAWKGGGEIIDKIKDKFKGAPKTGPGFMDKVKDSEAYKWMSKQGGKVSDLAGKGWKGIKEGAGNTWKKIEKGSEAWEKNLNKWGGGEWVEKNVGNRMDYYLNKWTAKPVAMAEKGGEFLEKKAAGLAPKAEAEVAKNEEQAVSKLTSEHEPHASAPKEEPTVPKAEEPHASSPKEEPPTSKAADETKPGGANDPKKAEENANLQHNPEESAERTKKVQDKQKDAQQKLGKEKDELKKLKKEVPPDEEKIAEAEAKVKEAKGEVSEAKEGVSNEAANQRAQRRLDEAKGYTKESDRFHRKNDSKEWEDSKHYRDPEKYKEINKHGAPELTKNEAIEKTWGAYSEKKEDKERQDEYNKELAEKGAHYNAENRAENAKEFAEHYSSPGHPEGGSPEGAPGHEGGPAPEGPTQEAAGPGAQGPDAEPPGADHADHADPGPASSDGGGGAAPSISALEPGGASGALSSKVHDTIGNLDDEEHDEKKDEEPKPGTQEQHSETKPADAGGSGAPPTPQSPAQNHDAQPGGQPQAQQGQPQHSESEGKSPEGAEPKEESPGAPGSVPYWPSLITTYQQDLKDLATTKQSLEDYKKAQLEGYKKAVGIKDDAQKNKETAAGRQPKQQHETAENQATTQEFTRSGGESTKLGGEAQKAKSKKDEGQGAGNEGASAASVNVPDPPAPHWWDRIINAIKSFLVNYVAKGLNYIQTAFANFILKHFAGVDMDALNKCANCKQQQNQEGAQETQKAQGDVGKSEAKDNETKAKNDETMSEAQQLQAKTKENIASADELIEAIGKIEGLLQQEIQAGNEFMANAAKEKQQAKQQEEAKQAAAEAKAKDDAAKKKQQDEAAQKAAEAKAQNGNKEHKDEASPEKVARVHQAAQLVASTASEYHNRVTTGYQAAKAALAGKNGDANAENAARIFDESAQETVSKHEQMGSERSAKMQSLAGKSFSKNELKEAASQIQEAASSADEDLVGALGAIKSAFDACYKHAHSPAQDSSLGPEHRRRSRSAPGQMDSQYA